MNLSSARISMLAGAFLLGLFAIGLHLWFVMGEQHEQWLLRSYRNRWAFRDVPSIRGSILDRQGRVLVHDEPQVHLSCHYQRFRLLHPIGAAVHGATLLGRSRDGDAGPRYGYGDSRLGPLQAFDDLMAMPLALLRRGALAKEAQGELLACAVTVLAACTDRPRRRIQSELLAAARDPGAQVLGQAAGAAAEGTAREAFARMVLQWHELDQAVVGLLAERRVLRGGRTAGEDPAEDPAATGQDGLSARLDRFRQQSLAGERISSLDDDGRAVDRGPVDATVRALVQTLPFDLAVRFALGAGGREGLILEPSLQRWRAADLDSTLRQLLGGVAELDRQAAPAGYVEDRAEAAIGDALEAELVPADAVPLPSFREELQDRLRPLYESLLVRKERRGTGGIELQIDEDLAGDPGLRLIERDAQAREQLLWSCLSVQPGNDVALTVDLDLQRLAAASVERALELWRSKALAIGGAVDLLDIGIAILDARSGDVLALAGAPNEVEGTKRLSPCLASRGAGDIGSLVKPFVLLEQLSAEAQGLPHRPLAEFAACSKVYDARRNLNCESSHGNEGRDPRIALAKSCNCFFFQAIEALGEDGLHRALRRAGLLRPDGPEDPFAAHWQPRPAELPAGMMPAPALVGRRQLAMRGIGYTVIANPLMVARAYAALATGSLPTVGFRRGEQRPQVPLDVAPGDLELVRDGLRACVETGTADKIHGLAAASAYGKTGTAEVGSRSSRGGLANNAWFAGYLPTVTASGVQLSFCAVVYHVPDGFHGAEAAGQLVADLLAAMQADPQLEQRYLRGEAPR